MYEYGEERYAPRIAGAIVRARAQQPITTTLELVDVIRSKRWWIVSMQLLIGAALGGVAFTIPTSWWLQGSLCFFWLMAFSSATHDIAADGCKRHCLLNRQFFYQRHHFRTQHTPTHKNSLALRWQSHDTSIQVLHIGR